MEYTAVTAAAGKGTRSGLDFNKVLYPLKNGKTLLELSLDLFESDPQCRAVKITCSEDDRSVFEEIIRSYPKAALVQGGSTRQASVLNALNQVQTEFVLIHDGARPFADHALLERIKTALQNHDAVIPVIPCVDTIKQIDENGFVIQTLPRNMLGSVQTPQGFRTELLKKANETALTAGYTGTDDASLVEFAGLGPVYTVKGDPANRKVTNPDDLRHLDQ